MLKHLALFALFADPVLSSGQTDAAPSYGLVHHRIEDADLGPVDIHLVDTLLDQKLPLVVFLGGSGAVPLIQLRKHDDGRWHPYSTFPMDQNSVGRRYHFVLISKPGVALADTVADDATADWPAAYTERLSAEWLARAASLAISEVLRRYPVETSRIGVLGFSEGGQTAPRVAAIDGRVTHVMAFAGGGLNQLFEPIIAARIAEAKGDLSHADAQSAIEELLADAERIYADPGSTTKHWWGHSYLRWSSFTDPSTVEILVGLDIPIYLAQGSSDTNTEPLGADFVRLEFIKRRKSNLTFRSWPGCDHFFNCRETAADGSMKETWRLEEAWEEAFRWFDGR